MIDQQELFNHMADQHGLTLLQGEMDAIIHLVVQGLEKEKSAVGKRVRWYPVDIDETYDGTIVEEKEFLYVVVPDDDHAPRSNWNKITCEIIGDS